MNRRAAGWLLSVAGVLLLALVMGCGQGESIPLVAPGMSDAWPADPGWTNIGGLFDGCTMLDGAADSVTGTIVVVGARGAVFEHRDEQWARPQLNLQTALRAVISLGNDEFLAVGDMGGIWRRTNGRWTSEESGTQAGLTAIVPGSEGSWVVGIQGTLLHWQDGDWQQLPTPTLDNLVSAAVVHDSVFVVSDAAGDNLLVWDGTRWGSIGVVPWGGRRVLGVFTMVGDHLYAAADSLYRRDPAGWQAITDDHFSEYHDGEVLVTKVVGSTLWYRYGSPWEIIEPALAPGQAQHYEWFTRSTIAPLGGRDFLTVNDGAQVYWSESGEHRLDPAGSLDVSQAYQLAVGEFLLQAERGIVRLEGSEPITIISAAELDSSLNYGVCAACGRDATDFYLTTDYSLHHYQDGHLARVGSWPAGHSIRSMALTGDQELHMADSHGLWRWTGANWLEERPLGLPENVNYKVWASGAGGLVARDSHGYFYRLEAGQWLPLGDLGSSTLVLAGADSSLVALQSENESVSFSGGNTLRVYDERAGVFHNLWGAGMGALQFLKLNGGFCHEGELLVWTSKPTMVFRLNGDPRRSEWEVVAGPVDADIKYLSVLPDRSLLGLDTRAHRFHLYQR